MILGTGALGTLVLGSTVRCHPLHLAKAASQISPMKVSPRANLLPSALLWKGPTLGQLLSSIPAPLLQPFFPTDYNPQFPVLVLRCGWTDVAASLG